MRFYLFLLLVLITIFSCKTEKNDVDVSGVEIKFTLKRFEKDFYKSDSSSLQNIKKEYPYLFPESFSDSLALQKINSKEEQELYEETELVFPNDKFLTGELTSLFKHIKYYYPKFTTPKVVTLASNIDYANRIILTDSLLLISLDTYLGKEHKFYNDFPKYVKETNTKNHLVVDVANAYINNQIPQEFNRAFIDKIIFEGKKLYLLDRYLPQINEHIKIGYSLEKLAWAKENEEQIWMYFIDKKLLFSTDTKLNKRFIENAPFSKFYLAQDNLSPGRIGVFIGWQIAKAYMQNNDVSLQEFLAKDTQEIFKNAKYKPKR